nr:uroporphyrinogen decarboxylase family protein [Rhizobium sp. ACO-34A]
MTETLGGEEHARRHLVYQREYDWDICKMVNDFQYPFPEGVESIYGPEDIERFQEEGMGASLFAGEIAAVKSLRNELGPETPIVFTTFDPLRQIVRRAGISTVPTLIANKDVTLRALRAINATLMRFMEEMKKAGADGVFLAINSAHAPGTPMAVDDDVFETFMKPFEIELLEAAGGMARFLHVHGNAVRLDRTEDYPFEVVSVSDRIAGNPTLADLREATGRCIMGGVDETRIGRMTPQELRDQIDESFRTAGQRNFILSPGCTIPVWTPAHLLRILAGPPTPDEC